MPEAVPDTELVRRFKAGDRQAYAEIVRLLGFAELVRGWPEWRRFVRSKSRRRGLDFLVDWLPRAHPELLGSA